MKPMIIFILMILACFVVTKTRYTITTAAPNLPFFCEKGVAYLYPKEIQQNNIAKAEKKLETLLKISPEEAYLDDIINKVWNNYYDEKKLGKPVNPGGDEDEKTIYEEKLVGELVKE